MLADFPRRSGVVGSPSSRVIADIAVIGVTQSALLRILCYNS